MVDIKNILAAVDAFSENGRFGTQEDNPEAGSINPEGEETPDGPEVTKEAHPPGPPQADEKVSAARQYLQYQLGDDWLSYVDREYPSGIDFEAQAEWEDPKGGRIYWLPNPNWNP
jgi:hypothetical protein